MQKPWIFLLLLLILLAITGTASVKARENRLASYYLTRNNSASSNPNLLVNPSFEGDYPDLYWPPDGHPDCKSGYCDSVDIAPGWTPWWESHNPADDDWIIHMPEYKKALLRDDPRRVWTGEGAQQYFKSESTHRAGFYQRVAVQDGKEYCFQIWGHSWSSNFDDPFKSEGQLEQWIGIDPTGGTPPTGGANWDSSDVIWGNSGYAIQQFNKFGLFNVCAEAQANYLTVYTKSEPIWAYKHNDVYWDDAVLSEYDGQPIEFQASPDGDYFFMVDVDEPQAFTNTIQFEFPDIELPPIPEEPPENSPPEDRFDWHSIITPEETSWLVRSTIGGQEGEDLIITVDSSGVPVGTYSAEIRLSSEPTVPGSPEWFTVELMVVEELYYMHIPYASTD